MLHALSNRAVATKWRGLASQAVHARVVQMFAHTLLKKMIDGWLVEVRSYLWRVMPGRSAEVYGHIMRGPPDPWHHAEQSLAIRRKIAERMEG